MNKLKKRYLEGKIDEIEELAKSLPSKKEIEEEIMRTVPPGALYGPVAIPDGIPGGWIVCDGQNGTPDMRRTPMVEAMTSHLHKNTNYVMKV
jgi:hypothetical protein